MTRTVRALRLVVVTSALQSLGVAATAAAAHGLWSRARQYVAGAAPGDPVRVSAALELAAWAGLAVCGLWFTAAVLACAHDLARHPTRPAPVAARDCLRPAFVRSLLVVLAGGSLVTPLPTPVSDHGPGWEVLDGLPLPGLPTGRAPRAPAPPAAQRATVVVRPGDCLWTITETIVGPHATDARVARTWPLLHRANRSVIGPDPDLLQAGTRLRVPATLTVPETERPVGAPR